VNEKNACLPHIQIILLPPTYLYYPRPPKSKKKSFVLSLAGAAVKDARVSLGTSIADHAHYPVYRNDAVST
jgi:hypothetical protein